MPFITRHRRLIALIALFSFFYLIGIGSLPLGASAKATGDQQPGAIEKVGPSGIHSVKKSPIIPILIGVVVVGAVAAVLILVVFKTKYDITGTWTGSITDLENDNTFPVTTVFGGDKKTGTLLMVTPDESVSGTYTVDGKDVTFIVDIESGAHVTCIGSFSDKDQMSGTWQQSNDPAHGTWTLTRSAEL